MSRFSLQFSPMTNPVGGGLPERVLSPRFGNIYKSDPDGEKSWFFLGIYGQPLYATGDDSLRIQEALSAKTELLRLQDKADSPEVASLLDVALEELHQRFYRMLEEFQTRIIDPLRPDLKLIHGKGNGSAKKRPGKKSGLK